MYEVIYMKADYEPWWQFEGWEEHIIERTAFENEAEAKDYLNSLLKNLRSKFPFEKEKQKEQSYWAFWNLKDQCYCDDCDEELQIYHGVIWNICK